MSAIITLIVNTRGSRELLTFKVPAEVVKDVTNFLDLRVIKIIVIANDTTNNTSRWYRVVTKEIPN